MIAGYRELAELGSGASGRVVAAVHEASGREVAVKLLSPELSANPRFAERFRVEARLLAGLASPHVVGFFEYVETDSAAAIVMELVAGRSLRDLLAREGGTGAVAALTVLKGSLLGLAAAHAAGVVHRDYKPENVLVTPDGVSKLTDFGIALRAGDQANAAGTPRYMAPEQWRGAPANPATDVYAATAVFFECLTGRRPYEGTTMGQLAVQHLTAPIPVEEVPMALRGLVARGLAKDAASRPPSAPVFLAELEKAAMEEYGEDWESIGAYVLGAAAGALLVAVPLVSTGAAAAGATSTASSTLGAAGRTAGQGGRRGLLKTTAGKVTAAVAATAVVGTAVIAGAYALKATSKPKHGYAVPSASVQLTGAQLASALLPVSDFPAGYVVPNAPQSNSGAAVEHDLAAMHCRDLFPFAFAGGFAPGFGESGFAGDTVSQDSATPDFFNQAIYQFATPAKAAAFFSGMRKVMAGCTSFATRKPVGAGVDAAPVDGKPAIIATILLPVANAGGGRNPITLVTPLLVLDGIDVYAVASGHMGGGPSQEPPASPTAPSLILKLRAAVAAMSRRGTTASAPQPPGAASPTGTASPSQDPVATVQAYIAAINEHDYQRAWTLGGKNLGQSYASFKAGYATTVHDTLTIVSVNGGTVVADLTAEQTDGTQRTYQGTYTVTDGTITRFQIRQTS